jgi:hypothetical protein
MANPGGTNRRFPPPPFVDDQRTLRFRTAAPITSAGRFFTFGTPWNCPEPSAEPPSNHLPRAASQTAAGSPVPRIAPEALGRSRRHNRLEPIRRRFGRCLLPCPQDTAETANQQWRSIQTETPPKKSPPAKSLRVLRGGAQPGDRPAIGRQAAHAR